MKMENKVKQARIRNGLSQERLAGLAGIGRSTISNIETGRYIPGVDTALLLAQALRCKVEDIFIIEREE